MGTRTGTYKIVLEPHTELLNFHLFEFQLLRKVVHRLRVFSFHLSKLNFKSNPLFPQLLGFCTLHVLQVLPLINLMLEVYVTLVEFAIGTLELVLLDLDISELQGFALE